MLPGSGEASLHPCFKELKAKEENKVGTKSTADFSMDHTSERSQKQGLNLLLERFFGRVQGFDSQDFPGTPCRGGFLSPVGIQHAGHPQNSSHLLQGIFSSENQLDSVLLF